MNETPKVSMWAVEDNDGNVHLVGAVSAAHAAAWVHENYHPEQPNLVLRVWHLETIDPIMVDTRAITLTRYEAIQ